MRDTKFIIQLSILILLDLILIIVLNFVSFDKKILSKDREKFVENLKQIDRKLQSINPIKKIEPKKVVVKEIIVPKIVYINKKEKIKKDKKLKKQNPILITSQKETKNADIKKEKKQTKIYTKLEKKFYKTYNYSIALKLAHLYYLNGQYNKALKWTKIANELNNKDDESWLLFAKIKIKQGEVEEAKKALFLYQNNFYSKKVSEFLKGISS